MTMTPPTPQYPRAGAQPRVDLAYLPRPLYRLQQARAGAQRWIVVVDDRRNGGGADKPQIGGW